MQNEMILVVRRSLFDTIGSFQGFSPEVDRYLPQLLSRSNNFFAQRAAAETDPSLKQIIPYALVVSQGKILRYRRGKGSGEQRLVAKGSVGIGGHMNDRDEGLFALDEAAYRVGVEREISEEIEIAPPLRHTIRGLINDDSTEVGKVHLGIVHVLEIPTPVAKKREAVITQLEFLSPAELAIENETLESWSQICLSALPQLFAP